MVVVDRRPDLERRPLTQLVGQDVRDAVDRLGRHAARRAGLARQPDRLGGQLGLRARR